MTDYSTAQQKIEERDMRAHWEDVDRRFTALIDGLSDTAIAQLKTDAINSMPEELRSVYTMLDIRRSRMLKAAALELMKASK